MCYELHCSGLSLWYIIGLLIGYLKQYTNSSGGINTTDPPGTGTAHANLLPPKKHTGNKYDNTIMQ